MALFTLSEGSAPALDTCRFKRYRNVAGWMGRSICQLQPKQCCCGRHDRPLPLSRSLACCVLMLPEADC